MPALVPHPHRRSRRAVALIAAAAFVLPGCAVTPPSGVTSATPTPYGTTGSPSAAASPDPSGSASSTSGATPSGSGTATTGPAATATGRLVFFAKNLVSDALKGTCQTRSGQPTLTLTDSRNDFYETVTLTVVLNRARTKVSSVTGDFGEDSEGIVRRLTVGAAKGTSATLKVTGSNHRITGRGQLYENGRATEVIPFTLTATCSSARW